MADDVKLLKKRITLKSIFRTTPQERKDYSKNVRKYNFDIMEQARLKELSRKEQEEYLRQFNSSIDKFNRAARSQVTYVYNENPYVAPAPVVQKSSGGSSRRSTSAVGIGSVSVGSSGKIGLSSEMVAALTKAKTPSFSKYKTIISSVKPSSFKRTIVKKNSRLFK